MRTLFSILLLLFATACASVPSERVDRRTYNPPVGRDFVHPDDITERPVETVARVARDGYESQVMIDFAWQTRQNQFFTQGCLAFVKPTASTIGTDGMKSCFVNFFGDNIVVEIPLRDGTRATFNVTASDFVCIGRIPRAWQKTIFGDLVLSGRSTTSRPGEWEEVSCSSAGFAPTY